MKRLCLRWMLLPLLLLAVQSSVAQINYMADMVTKKKPIRWGVIAGLNVADFSLNGSQIELETDPGWQVGMMASISLGKRWTIDPQFLYVRHKLDLRGYSMRGDMTCSSIDVPIGVGYKIFGPLRLFAGPVFTLMNECDGDYEFKDFSGSNRSRDNKIDASSLRTTLSYVVGAEVRLFNHLRVDVRYNGQFKKKDDVMLFDGKEGAGKARSQLFSLNVGYYF